MVGNYVRLPCNTPLGLVGQFSHAGPNATANLNDVLHTFMKRLSCQPMYTVYHTLNFESDEVPSSDTLQRLQRTQKSTWETPTIFELLPVDSSDDCQHTLSRLTSEVSSR